MKRWAKSIPAALLYSAMLDDPVTHIAGAGHDTRILFGALLELLLIIANIGSTLRSLQGVLTIPEAARELFLASIAASGGSGAPPILTANTR